MLDSLIHQPVDASMLGGGTMHHVPGLHAELREALASSAAAVAQDGVRVAREAGLDAVGGAIESLAGSWRAIAAAAAEHGASVTVLGTRGGKNGTHGTEASVGATAVGRGGA